MKGYEIKKKRKGLKVGFDAAVTYALTDAICKSSNKKPAEPDYVASLVREMPDKIRDILSIAFPNDHFIVTGIFCHQKPIVNIELSKNPELGDLLLVFHLKSNKGDKFNSLLLQAKKIKKTIYKIPSAERHQLELYTKWPKFTYLRAGKLNGKIRDIIPKATNTGAQYLLIKEKGTSGSALSVSPADSQVGPFNTFSETLINFLAFTTGRAFEGICNESDDDDWTNMIQDLLNVGGCSVFTRKNSGLNKQPRRYDALYCLNKDRENSASGDTSATSEENGISVIFIQCIEDDADNEEGLE